MTLRRFSEVIFEFREALKAGISPSVEEYLELYPEYADRLSSVLPAISQQIAPEPPDAETLAMQERILPRVLAFVENLACPELAEAGTGDRTDQHCSPPLPPKGGPCFTLTGICSTGHPVIQATPGSASTPASIIEGSTDYANGHQPAVFGDLVGWYLQLRHSGKVSTQDFGVPLDAFRQLQDDRTPVEHLVDNTVVASLARSYSIPFPAFSIAVRRIQNAFQCVGRSTAQPVFARASDPMNVRHTELLEARLFAALTGGGDRDAEVAHQTRKRS